MNMKKLAFVVALVAFVIGFSDLQENLFFWLGRPVGAIAFILYFILMILEKESARFDAEQQQQETTSVTPSNSEKRATARPNGLLTTVSPH